MSLSRAYEEHEVGPEIARIFSEVRQNFDLPFIPTLFKFLAGEPDYLRIMWRDLGPVAASKEFHHAADALEEYVRSLAISGGWRFGDQERVLAEHKISTTDMPVLSGVVGVFARALPRMALFVRLMQMGYSGGQQGHITSGKAYPALSRLVSLHIPPEKDASLRVWLLYSEIKRATGSNVVMSLYRALSPFPGYLAASWMDTKRVMADREFGVAKQEIARRCQALTLGLPVRDHRGAGKTIPGARWRDIEALVDNFARMLPQYSLVAWVWRRSFNTSGKSRAA